LKFALTAPEGRAAVRTWSGSGPDNFWNTAGNWSGTAPANADQLIFTGTTRQSNTNNYSALSVNALSFGTAGFLLNGANQLALNGPLTNSAGTNILNQPINVTAQNAVWNIAAGTEVQFAGPLTNNQTANPLATLGFGGTVRITSTNALPNRFFTLTSGAVIADGCNLITSDGFRLQPGTGSTAVFQLTNNAFFSITSGGNLRLCQTATGGSTRLDLASGTLSVAVTSGAGAGDIFVGEAANTTTVFNQNGGLVTFPGNGNNRIVFANASASANGTYNLNGGILWTKQITQVTAGSPGGTFNFNGGVLKPITNSIAFFQGVQTANILAGGAFIDTTNLAVTIGQSLAGNGNLVKTGSGSLTLTGTDTYTGSTIISNGTLMVATGVLTGGGALVVGDGATLSLTNTGSTTAVSTLTLGRVGASTLQFNFPAGNAGSATLNAASLVANGTAGIKITGSGLTAGTIPLATYTSATGLGNLYLASVPPGVIASLSLTGTSLNLVISSVGKAITWTGAADNNWNTSTVNWADLGNGSNPTNYAQPGGVGDLVTFDDTLSANPAINLTTALSPLTMTFNNNGAAYSFGGPGKLTGLTTIVKGGFQGLTLGTVNDFTGGAILNAGVINCGADQALGSGVTTLNLGTIASDGATPRTLGNGFLQNANTGVILGDQVNNGTLTL
ncbi:MAG TPA: autotransporter-associated beta strand repeat-containing protein, partial [Verrucomicrobiae bacterium]